MILLRLPKLVWMGKVESYQVTLEKQLSISRSNSLLFRLVEDGIYALGKPHMRSIPSHRLFFSSFLWNGSNVRLTDDGPLSSFQRILSSTFSFQASLLQAIDGAMSLALCPQVVAQAPQLSRSSEKQATCECCYGRQFIHSVVSLHSGMSRAVHPQEFSKGGVDYCHNPVWASHSTFGSKLIESVRTIARVVRLSPLQVIQRRARVTASTSIVKMELETV